jgi:hypothetical protein
MDSGLAASRRPGMTVLIFRGCLDTYLKYPDKESIPDSFLRSTESSSRCHFSRAISIDGKRTT